MTISELIDAYMLRLEAENRSVNTLRAYEADLRQLAAFIGPDTNIEAIDCTMLRTYLAQYAEATRRRKHAVIKCCLEEALNLYKLSRNVAESVYTPKMRQRLPYCPPEPELLRALDGNYAAEFSNWPARDKALLEIAYSTMVRIDELHGMDVEHINWSLRWIRVTGKGDKQRMVPLGKPATLALRAYLRERELLLRKLKKPQISALFVSSPSPRGHPKASTRGPYSAGSRMSVRRLHSTIKRMCIGLGLPRAIHPHSLRRAGATHMLNRGEDLRVIKALLGHEKLSTTAIYCRLAPERLRSVFEATHPDNRKAG